MNIDEHIEIIQQTSSWRTLYQALQTAHSKHCLNNNVENIYEATKLHINRTHQLRAALIKSNPGDKVDVLLHEIYKLKYKIIDWNAVVINHCHYLLEQQDITGFTATLSKVKEMQEVIMHEQGLDAAINNATIALINRSITNLSAGQAHGGASMFTHREGDRSYANASFDSPKL